MKGISSWNYFYRYELDARFVGVAFFLLRIGWGGEKFYLSTQGTGCADKMPTDKMLTGFHLLTCKMKVKIDSQSYFDFREAVKNYLADFVC